MKSKFVLSFIILLNMAAAAQQADLSLVPYRVGNRWGYASPDKKIVIKPVYEYVNWFYLGYAVVKKGSKYGYIDRTGKLIIPYKFTVAKPFRFGYINNPAKNKEDTVLFAGASLQANGYEICINTRGARMPKCPAINENSVSENYKPDIAVKEKTYTLNSDNNLFDRIIDDYSLADSSATYYIAMKNNFFGVFNNKFEVIVPFEYNTLQKITVVQNTYLLAKKNEMEGVLSGNGAAFIPVENNNLRYVKARNGNDYFIVSKEGKAGLRNVVNKDILAQKYSNVEYDEQGGFIITGPGNLKGYYFLNDQLIEPKYSEVQLAAGGKYLLVKTSTGKTGYVNTGGEEYFSE